MSGAARVGIFALGLVLVFAAAAAAGSLFEPADTESEPAHAEGRDGGQDHADEGQHADAGAHTPQPPRGLAIAEDGYSLRLARPHVAAGEPTTLRFSVAGPDGEPVRDFDTLHERRMHLVVVRRDGAGFRHLHPEVDAAGVWSTPLAPLEPGAHRIFADFSVGAEQLTLASDLFAAGGDFEARPFPAPAPLAAAGPYEVRLEPGDPHAGRAATLSFAVSKDGEPVRDIAPYLGAKGHLVALREGDLAFLHVHPVAGEAGEIAFAATFPSAGRYRLYLQFRHDGEVRTAEFTVEVQR